ncbi:CPBP family intramembrane glutamic endopeptidase [Arthrobacter sp. GMC3]|uniref:CPBP family intramembrane glutamic endopeptidase n=1 Tax=Arthrobacter sp. GMC3 TaxID=2058894 RepID=UPI000CE310D5|nr:CPBP family intramembrane glutamic endopeptidase [Arthrobacter sp. GMC3]
MTDLTAATPWKRFWDRGAWWKTIVLAVAYIALYEGASLLLGVVVGGDIGTPNSPKYLLLGFLIPIAIGGLILVAFAASVGWLKDLFGQQPIRGGRWMWIAVVVVLLFNLLRFASLDYAKAGFTVVALWIVIGLMIGFAEEVLTRGLVVNIMRKAGHREIVVALVSAGIFALLHSVNLLSGQALLPTLIQLGYTFAFGILMYLALRVTGNLIWPVLLHASTDPSVFLLTAYPSGDALSSIANLGNFVVIAAGLVLVFFIRGRVADDSNVALSSRVAP